MTSTPSLEQSWSSFYSCKKIVPEEQKQRNTLQIPSVSFSIEIIWGEVFHSTPFQHFVLNRNIDIIQSRCLRNATISVTEKRIPNNSGELFYVT